MGEGKSGLVNSLIVGTGGLIIGVIIILMIIGTVDDANLLRGGGTTVTDNRTNLTFAGHTLVNWNTGFEDFTISKVITNTSVIVPSANYTLDSKTGIVRNATAKELHDVNVTYGYFVPTSYELATEGMQTNLTEGIGEISVKIPTILLIAAVVLLFGVLAILVARARQMGIGGGGSASL